MTNDDQLPFAEALCQVLGQLDSVSHELSHAHRGGRLDAWPRLTRAALVPFDYDKVGLELPVQSDRRHLGLAGSAVQLQQERAIGASTPHE